MRLTRAQIVNGTGFDRDAVFIQVTESLERELLSAAQAAEDAAGGNSNDDEIEALRDAYETAFGVLGIKIPEGREECDECEQLVDPNASVSTDHDAACSLHPDNVVDDASCKVCREEPAVEWDMCDSCLHDAKRSGWNPPSE